MTEVTHESPMKIQQEEIKVQDVLNILSRYLTLLKKCQQHEGLDGIPRF